MLTLLFLSALFMPPSFDDCACALSTLPASSPSLPVVASGAKARELIKLGSGRRRGGGRAATLLGDISLEDEVMLSARSLLDVGEVIADPLLCPFGYAVCALAYVLKPSASADGSSTDADVVFLARVVTVAAAGSTSPIAVFTIEEEGDTFVDMMTGRKVGMKSSYLAISPLHNCQMHRSWRKCALLSASLEPIRSRSRTRALTVACVYANVCDREKF